MSRFPLVVGNWKMHKRISETEEFCAHLREQLVDFSGVQVAVAPPFTSLATAARVLKGSPILVSAQNSFWAEWGAFTGEISPLMLLDAGCQFSIIGHSERRQFFGETDESVNKKILALLKTGLIPIFCVGETLSEREAGKAFSVVEKQIKAGLAGVKINNPQELVIAYEPVWAIGTGKTAKPQQAQEMQAFIRQIMRELFSPQLADTLRILYGGSVQPDNIAEIIAQDDVDGALVGGASLEINSFVQIIKACGGQKGN
ncbi:MAG: triose-phosphate isomerase [Thermodesulfobacteriota bacterium]